MSKYLEHFLDALGQNRFFCLVKEKKKAIALVSLGKVVGYNIIVICKFKESNLCKYIKNNNAELFDDDELVLSQLSPQVR